MSVPADRSASPAGYSLWASRWVRIRAHAPALVDTMHAYLAEVAKTLAAHSVEATESTLRSFAGWLVDGDPACTTVAAVTAAHIDDYRAWLAGRPSPTRSRPVSAATVEYRTAMLRLFFERIAAWGAADSPSTMPISRQPAVRRPRPARLPKRVPAVNRAKPPEPAHRPSPQRRGPAPEMSWTDIADRAPRLAVTMTGYLHQLATSSRPTTVEAASLVLRHLAAHLVQTDPACQSVKTIERRHIESYKIALVARPGHRGDKPITNQTVRHNLGMLRTFFERIIDWDDPDAPRRVPIFEGDIPKADEPLPKFLDDPTAAKFMAALADDPDRRRRLIVELLARTGMRVGELGGLRDDAMYKLGDTYWLRVPLGKLHNDRTVPLHPMLVALITDYRIWRGPTATGLLVERDDHHPFDRRTLYRYVQAVARRAGIGPVHPHQLRHTLATQCLNRGMSLEAIAALLGHRSPRMTLVYARISDTTVAEQYFNATQMVETEQPTSPVGDQDLEAIRVQRRLLGNGHCARPVELDCRFQTICEGCGFFQTDQQFVTILRRQRDDAAGHGDTARTELYNQLVKVIDQAQSDSSG